jgi:hypothetical protein
MKEVSIEMEYCVLMVAIMLVRMVVDPLVNSFFQKAEDVAQYLNDLNTTEDYKTCFDVNPVALSHGIKMCVKVMKGLGCETDIKRCKSSQKLIEAFNDLEASTNAYQIKFNNLQGNYTDVEPTKSELHQRIGHMRDDIYQRMSWAKPDRESLLEVKCCMYVLGKDMKHMTKDVEVVTPAIRKKKSRKAFDECGVGHQYKIGKAAFDEMEFEYSATHCITIFDIATSVAQKKIRIENGDNGAGDKNSDVGEGDNDDDDGNGLNDSGDFNVDLSAIEDDPKIKEALANLNRKVLIYSLTDKMEILRVYDLVFDILTMKGVKGNVNWNSARETVMILSKYPGYQELNPRSIVNWKQRSKMPNKKTGKKINQDFDDTVWSNLMICKMEKQVRYISVMMC